MKYSKIALLSATLSLLAVATPAFAQEATTPACPSTPITRTMTVGSTDATTGGDVSRLQAFLGISPTGYFGPITKGKAAAWQAAHNVSPAVGYVGPLTRAAIASSCSAGTPPSNPNMGFTASPTTGTAPLQVAFDASGSGYGSGQYIIDYGDGANSGPLQSYCIKPVSSTATSSCSFSAGHTYQNAGTYAAVLQAYTACMWSSPRCELATQPLGQATITVGKVATSSTLTIPGSVTLAPGASAKNLAAYSTYTLAVNSVSVAALSASITWTESHCGTSGCAGAADPAPQTVTLKLSGGGSSYTSALGHTIILTAVGGSNATFSVPN